LVADLAVIGKLGLARPGTHRRLSSMAISPSRSQSPTPPSTGDLARLILARCSEPGYAQGGRLPTERRLAEEFSVTRTAVRHALALLEAERRISREVGRGTFLRTAAVSPGVSELPRDAAEVSPADVMAARRLIEPPVIPLVVAWATPRDFDEMRRCVEGGASADSFEEFERWDYALHHAIVAASRNQLLVVMYGAIENARKGAIWGNLKRRRDSRERRAAYQAEHAELVDALCARELDHAVSVMEAHLSRVQANLLGPAPPLS
jgi:DNA-binding FadR family transcriptional regulator